MVLCGVTLHDDLALGHDEVNGYVSAFTAMPMVGFDHQMTAGDLGIKSLQRRGALANARFDGLAGRHIAKGDSKGYLHGTILARRVAIGSTAAAFYAHSAP